MMTFIHSYLKSALRHFTHRKLLGTFFVHFCYSQIKNFFSGFTMSLSKWPRFQLPHTLFSPTHTPLIHSHPSTLLPPIPPFRSTVPLPSLSHSTPSTPVPPLPSLPTPPTTSSPNPPLKML